MLQLDIKVWHQDGRVQYVKDWLVASDQPLPLRKLRHYCRCVNAMEAYESGDITNFPGKGVSGRLKLVVETSPDYGDQNRVADYIPADATVEAPVKREPVMVPEPEAKLPPDSEIPF